jgi:putative methyltransferase (TIGR04325 family)
MISPRRNAAALGDARQPDKPHDGGLVGHRGLSGASPQQPGSILRRSVGTVARLVADAYSYLAFPHRGGQFRGIYDDFPQAEVAAPKGKKLGYDHPDLAREYQKNLSFRLESFDYPILFHLARIMDGCRTVFDFGGNLGVHYLRYRRYLKLDHVKWIVLDLPEITSAGRQTCADLPNIAFINEIAEFRESGLDILLASGSMQYLASPNLLLEKMADQGARPAHVLINRVPLYEGPQFVTLQNGGLVYYPQYVFNREMFIRSIENLDYELVDAWPDPADSCIIPFHPARSVRAYTGLYFQTGTDVRKRQTLARNNAAGKMIGTT